MALPSSLRYKARKREKAREAERKAAYEATKKVEVENPTAPVVENPTGSVVVDPASDYLLNGTAPVVENPIGAYVENPSDQLGKHLPPMEQEEHNIIIEKVRVALDNTEKGSDISIPVSSNPDSVQPSSERVDVPYSDIEL